MSLTSHRLFWKSSLLAAWLCSMTYIQSLRAVGRDVSAGPPTVITARQIGKRQLSSLNWLFFLCFVMCFLFFHDPTTKAHVTCYIRPFLSNWAFWNENHNWILRKSSTWCDGHRTSDNPSKRSRSLSSDLMHCTHEEVRRGHSEGSSHPRLKMPWRRQVLSPCTLPPTPSTSAEARVLKFLCKSRCVCYITDRLVFCPNKPRMFYLSSQLLCLEQHFEKKPRKIRGERLSAGPSVTLLFLLTSRATSFCVSAVTC